VIYRRLRSFAEGLSSIRAEAAEVSVGNKAWFSASALSPLPTATLGEISDLEPH